MNLINSKEKTSYKVHKPKEKKSKLHYRNYTPPETSDDRYTSCDSRRSKHKSKKQHKPERHDKQKTEKHDKHSGRESSKRKAHRVSDDESFTPPPKRREPEMKKLDRSPTRKYIDPPAKLVAPEEPAKISETVAVSNAAFKGNVFLQLKSSGSNNIHSLSLISEIALTQPSGKIKLELEPTKKRHHIKKTAFPKPATLSVAPSLDTSLHGEPNFNYTLNVSNIPMPSDLAILHDLGQTTIGSRISTPKLCPSPGSSSIGSSSTKKSAGFAPFSLKSNTLPRLDGKPNNILLSVYTPKNLSDGELEDSPIKYPELVQVKFATFFWYNWIIWFFFSK